MTQIAWPGGGFTWTAAGAWASFLALCGIIVRQIGPWRKQSIDAEKIFRDGLIKRVELLEVRLEAERARHDAQMAIARHRLNNITGCFDALLLLIETNPERAAEAVAKVKEMRAAQMEAEASENAIFRASLVESTGKRLEEEI
jgi:hypothetical protein